MSDLMEWKFPFPILSGFFSTSTFHSIIICLMILHVLPPGMSRLVPKDGMEVVGVVGADTTDGLGGRMQYLQIHPSPLTLGTFPTRLCRGTLMRYSNSKRYVQ